MSFVKKYWLVGAVIAVILIFLLNDRDSGNGTIVKNEEHQLITETEEVIEEETEVENMVVDIKGAVHSPGIYEGSPGMRVHEIVTLAGGFTEDADETSVNLAQKIEDEMVVLVYSLQTDESGTSGDTSVSQGGDKIRINQATMEEITSISGIGPSKAEAIVAYREENGMFKDVEDLLEVSGIGEKTLENMKDEIQIP